MGKVSKHVKHSFPKDALFAWHDMIHRAKEMVRTEGHHTLRGYHIDILTFDDDASLDLRQKVCEAIGADQTFLCDFSGEFPDDPDPED
jgi:hypothetical protein